MNFRGTLFSPVQCPGPIGSPPHSLLSPPAPARPLLLLWPDAHASDIQNCSFQSLSSAAPLNSACPREARVVSLQGPARYPWKHQSQLRPLVPVSAPTEHRVVTPSVSGA